MSSSSFFGNAQTFSQLALEGLSNVSQDTPVNDNVLTYEDGFWKPKSGGGAGTGDVLGPNSSTNNAISRMDGVTGKRIDSSGVLLSDTNDISGAKSFAMDGSTSGTLTLRPAATTTSHSLFFPPTQSVAGGVLTDVAGNGNLSWQVPSASGGDVTGDTVSVDQTLVRWNGTTGKAIQRSNLTLSDSDDLIGAKSFSMSGATSGSVALQPSAVTSNHTLTLPAALGPAGGVLTDAAGNGQLSWTLSGNGDVSGDTLSVDNTLVRWTGTSGKAIQRSSVVLSDIDELSGLKSVAVSGSTSGAVTVQAADVTTPHTIKLPATQGALNTYLQNDGAGNTSWNSIPAAIQENFTAIVDPTINDDTTLGYSVGSRWLNTVKKIMYVCNSNSTGAAQWMVDARKNNLAAVNAPLFNDDVSKGYAVGSIWYFNGLLYMCNTATVDNAQWDVISSTKTFVTTTNPGPVNGAGQGFKEASIWVNADTNSAYVCLDATQGSAIWAGFTQDYAARLYWSSMANGDPTTVGPNPIPAVAAGLTGVTYLDANQGVRLTIDSVNQEGILNWDVTGFDFTRDFVLKVSMNQGGADGVYFGFGGSSALTGIGSLNNGSICFAYNTFTDDSTFYVNGVGASTIPFKANSFYDGIPYTSQLIVRRSGNKRYATLYHGYLNLCENAIEISSWAAAGTWVYVGARCGLSTSIQTVNNVVLDYL